MEIPSCDMSIVSKVLFFHQSPVQRWQVIEWHRWKQVMLQVKVDAARGDKKSFNPVYEKSPRGAQLMGAVSPCMFTNSAQSAKDGQDSQRRDNPENKKIRPEMKYSKCSD